MALISLNFNGDTPTGVTLDIVTRTDTGASLSGFPAAMTLTGGAWDYTIAEPAPALTYNFAWTATWSDTSTFTGTGSVQGTAGTAAGWYTDQPGVQSKWGRNNIATWSNLDSTTPNNADGTPVPSVPQIQVALNSTDAAINALSAVYNRQTPIPKTIALWAYLSDLAAYDAGVRLYEARGLVLDKGAEGMGGVLARKKMELWGDPANPKVIGLLPRFFKNASAIQDIPRVGTVTTSPAVVLSQVVVPFGCGGVNLPAGQIAVIPNSNSRA